MTTMTDIGVTGALFLLDTYDTSKLRNYFREKIDKAASAGSSAVEGSLGTPKAREATMDKGVEALKAALDTSVLIPWTDRDIYTRINITDQYVEDVYRQLVEEYEF